jgi:hypothetical protein
MMRDDETSADASLRETRVVLARQRARTLRVVAIARGYKLDCEHYREQLKQADMTLNDAANRRDAIRLERAATARAEQAERDREARRIGDSLIIDKLRRDLAEARMMAVAQADHHRAFEAWIMQEPMDTLHPDSVLARSMWREREPKLSSEQRVLVESWRADAERKDNGNG